MSHLIKPLMTEKASRLVGENTYSFEIHDDINKHALSELLEKMYKVKVKQVRIAKHKGKVKRVGKTGKTKQLPDTKVAFVTLKEGKIDIFPQA